MQTFHELIDILDKKLKKTPKGDGSTDGRKVVDAEEMYKQAIEYYSKAIGLTESDNASKVLKP